MRAAEAVAVLVMLAAGVGVGWWWGLEQGQRAARLPEVEVCGQEGEAPRGAGALPDRTSRVVACPGARQARRARPPAPRARPAAPVEAPVSREAPDPRQARPTPGRASESPPLEVVITLDRQARDALTARPPRLLPVYRDRRLFGLRVRDAEDAAQRAHLARLGLAAGDLVLAIDGRPVGAGPSPVDPYAASGHRPAQLELLRGRQRVVLRYRWR